MKKELPDVKAFSVTNLHYMVWFYELYPDAINLPQIWEDFNGRRKYIYASDLMELRERCGKLI